MKFLLVIFLIPALVFSQNTFKYNDKEFQVGGLHITAHVKYETCQRLEQKPDPIIDSLFKFLSINKTISIEVSSHTDSRGSDSYNLKLSERRAQNIVNHLIKLGIDSARLTYKGCGESQPIITEETIKEKMTNNSNQKVIEKLHAINRRNEIKITKIDH